MSSFYSDASLVMIPSGYKTSKVYSAKPTDGAGDLVFTRSNDTATRVGPDGLIEKVRTNLLLQSNTFSTTWLPLSGGAVTGGQSGYDGTNNAWLLSKSAAGGFIYQTANSFNGQYTLSIYAKANASTHIRINGNAITDGDAFFNLSTGAVQSSTNCVAKIVSVGGGWYRCSITSTDANLDYVNIYPAEASGVSATSGSVFIQNSQLETGDVMTDYIVTTTAAVSVGPVANLPRLDYLNSSCPRLLLEPQRSNLVLFSEQMNVWTNGTASVTANATTSPDGYQNADSINNTADVSTFVGASNVAHTFSLFVKQGTSATASIDMSDGATGDVITTFTFATKTFSGTSAGGSWTSPSTAYQDYGNGWYRISLTATKGAGSKIGYKIIASGTGTTFVWGAQLEQGYASSYINTLGAAVTRTADAASKTGISSLIGQTEGTLFAEFEMGVENTHIFLYTNASNAIYIQTGIGDMWRAYVINGGVYQVAITAGTPPSSGFVKMAFAYKENDFVLYANGSLIGSDNSGSVPACSSLDLGLGPYGVGQFGPKRTKQTLLFPTRLTNAQLAELTTL